MAAFALLLAYSRLRVRRRNRPHVGFSPKVADTPFTAFWSLGCGWGTCTLDAAEIRLQVESGALRLSSFASSRLASGTVAGGTVTGVRVGEGATGFRREGATLVFSNPVLVVAGAPLTISLAAAV